MKDYIVDSVFYYLPEEVPDHPEDREWGDKVIVMARLEEENTDWVENELPEYATPLSQFLWYYTSTREILLTKMLSL